MQKDKFLIINSRNNGFFSNFLHTIDQIIFADQNNLVPVINWGNNNDFLYKDLKYEETNNVINCWDYYFKPINHYNIYNIEKNNILKIVNDFNIPPYVPFNFSQECLYNPHKIDFDTFDIARKNVEKYINKYVFLKPEVLEKIENFKEQNFKNNKIISIHIRGTDRWTESKNNKLSKLKNYKNLIDENYKNFDKIFVCTDSEETINYFKDIYNNLIVFNSERSDKHNGNPVHFYNGCYKTGEDVLCESYLMSCTDYLLLSDSNVPLSSLYINKELKFKYYKYEELCI